LACDAGATPPERTLKFGGRDESALCWLWCYYRLDLVSTFKSRAARVTIETIMTPFKISVTCGQERLHWTRGGVQNVCYISIHIQKSVQDCDFSLADMGKPNCREGLSLSIANRHNH
jgi:hypothetical protein